MRDPADRGDGEAIAEEDRSADQNAQSQVEGLAAHWREKTGTREQRQPLWSPGYQDPNPEKPPWTFPVIVVKTPASAR